MGFWGGFGFAFYFYLIIPALIRKLYLFLLPFFNILASHHLCDSSTIIACSE